jgi:hypothetical protein
LNTITKIHNGEKMATKKELGKELAEYLENNAINQGVAVGEVVEKINRLRYTDSKNPLNITDKLEIVAEIENELVQKKTKDGRILVEAVDSSSYIELINMIRAQMGAK